jgi:hypothetical protein
MAQLLEEIPLQSFVVKCLCLSSFRCVLEGGLLEVFRGICDAVLLLVSLCFR